MRRISAVIAAAAIAFGSVAVAAPAMADTTYSPLVTCPIPVFADDYVQWTWLRTSTSARPGTVSFSDRLVGDVGATPVRAVKVWYWTSPTGGQHVESVQITPSLSRSGLTLTNSGYVARNVYGFAQLNYLDVYGNWKWCSTGGVYSG